MMVAVVPTKLAAKQIAALRGKPRASFLLAVDDIRRRDCAGAGVRLTGAGLSDICRLDLYGAWRLLTVFETKDRCILLLVAEHTRTAKSVPAHLRRPGHQRTCRAAHKTHMLRRRGSAARRC